MNGAVYMPYALRRALAWWMAAELVRRHPALLRVIETHPGGGQYDCLSLYHRQSDALVANFNLTGSIHVPGWSANVRNDPPTWADVLASEDRRGDLILPIERCAGLQTPKETPATTEQSVGIRLLARFAALAAFSARCWSLRNAYNDNSGMGSGVQSWATAIAGPKYERLEGDLLRTPHYRYWFVLDQHGKPATAIDVDRGLAWCSGKPGEEFNLMKLYRARGSHLDATLAAVLLNA
jgi:hypothetical protein